eukprot:CAMPEP_0205824822 /NCGR_PEP_ID=MMETSP0206-20130828/22864_1 /ASSEMBLY_ACC=CAM_ASM_000279 /TAXON_ID=36767 /ORGANISM="Euplotes focardii, Strain TN1" /LENGTH=351 /DNA_ID=CAMNT_0053123309 /DNA_START=85 /DNA_END=1140 /DNA_ORIENTATION=+
MNGNPTQNVERLAILIWEGMPSGESVDAFHEIYAGKKGNEQHGAADEDVANSFYSLATSFYEYGWGHSFHFGFRGRHEGHGVSIANSEDFVANKLRVGDMDRVLDMGCGVGGPLRGVVKRTGANVTGLTINEFQVERARAITSGLTPYMQARCHFELQNYMDVKGLEENAYDAAFYMESSLHCEDHTKTFKEAFRLLKPGGRLVALEYVTLDAWDPTDPEMAELMRQHLLGNGAARTPTIEEDLAMVRAAGFVIEDHFDFMARGEEVYGDDHWPWWADLQFNWWPHLLSAHPWVRKPLPTILHVLSTLGLVSPDVGKAADLMNLGGDGLSGLGKLGAITPQYYVLGIKPLE